MTPMLRISKYELDILTLRDWYGDTWKHLANEKLLSNWIPELVQKLIAHISWKLGPRANIGPAKKVGHMAPRFKLDNGDMAAAYTTYFTSKIATAYWKLGIPWRNDTATESFKRILALCNYALVLEGLEYIVIDIEQEYARIEKEEAIA